LGVGAVFPTGSKADADYVSYEELKKICSEVSLPCVAIGGINKKNLHKLSGSGICGIAVISAILAAKDIKKASLELAQKLEGII
ncbi:MAG: thiamine phosphate synthase, partial [Clostridia bacterium]|nr:thiamine phosphate synthase [Clostridia bacterium]